MESSMPLFRKRPVVVEAVQNLPGAEVPSWLQDAVLTKKVRGQLGGHLAIDTGGGPTKAITGDWIVRDAGGAVFAVKPLLFDATYELAT